MRDWLGIGMIGLLLVVGCGREEGLPRAPIGDSGNGQSVGLPNGEHRYLDQKGIDLLIAMGRAQRALTGATYEARLFSRGAAGKKPAAVPWAGQGEWEGRVTCRVAYVAPGRYLMEWVGATDPALIGLKALLGPAGAGVRLPGLLAGAIVRHRPLDHPDLSTYRGHPLAWLTPAATVARLAGAASARYVGETRLDGQLLDLVEIPQSPPFDPLIAREVVGLERGTQRLRSHGMYTSEGLAYQFQAINLHANPPEEAMNLVL